MAAKIVKIVMSLFTEITIDWLSIQISPDIVWHDNNYLFI